MKTFIKTIASLWAVLLSFSCTLTKIDTQMTDEQAIAAIRLECSAEAGYTVQAEKTQVISFHVSSTTPWAITGQEQYSSWLTVAPASSAVSSLSEDVRVSILSANESQEDRVATLTLSGENTSITRKIVITQLKSSGLKVEFADDVQPSIDPKGGDVLIKVNANTEWKIENTNTDFTAEKVSENQIKVSTNFNNKFAARKTLITIRATDPEHADISSTKAVNQDINFSLSEGCEVQGDGSVKIFGASTGRISTVDEYRFVKLVYKIGEKNIGSSCSMWCATNVGSNIYSQITLGGNLRVRQDGNIPGTEELNPEGGGVSTYGNASISIDENKLKAITEYRLEVLPTEEMDETYPTVPLQEVSFWYNGEKNATLKKPSTLGYNKDASGSYWFGFEKETEDGSWYIVESCDIYPVAE